MKSLSDAGTPLGVPIVLLLILGLSWGLHYSVLKVAMGSGFTVVQIIVLTTLLVVFGLTVIAILRQRWPRLNRRHLRFYIVCAFLGYLAEFPLALTVAEKIPAGLLAIIGATSPLFTSAIALLFKVETVSRRRLMSIGIGLVASLIVLVPGTALPKPDLLFWVLIAFCIPFLYALYHNYVAVDWPDGADSWQVAHGESLIAAIIVLGFFVITGQQVPDFSAINTSGWGVVMIAGLSIVEIYLYFEIVRRVGAVFVSLGSFVTIFAGVLWGMVLFGEQHGMWIWLGFGLLAVSLLLIRETTQDSKHDISVDIDIKSDA